MEGETGSRVRREITNKRESDADDHRARRLSRDSMFQKTAHLTLVLHQRNAGQKKNLPLTGLDGYCMKASPMIEFPLFQLSCFFLIAGHYNSSISRQIEDLSLRRFAVSMTSLFKCASPSQRTLYKHMRIGAV